MREHNQTCSNTKGFQFLSQSNKSSGKPWNNDLVVSGWYIIAVSTLF